MHHLPRQRKGGAVEPGRRAAFARTHTAYLVADWTKRDAAITALLSAHDRSGVPLYLYYKPGATDAEVLPQILTPTRCWRRSTAK